MKNILFTGKGSSASFQVRGVQLGNALGAVVQPNAIDIAGYDIGVVVKRCPTDLLERLRGSKVKIIHDIVDAYPQPVGNEWSMAECLEWLKASVRRLKPDGIVAATQAMAADCEQFGVPVLALPHHAWPGKPINPIRPKVLSVGYQGGVGYLGRWHAFMDAECKKRGFTFEVNPVSLADVDIGVALREQTGYAARQYKSNCKLANAQGSGTPFICNREAGYMETACGAERFADTKAEMVEALDYFTDHDNRIEASQRMLAAAPKLIDVAKTYREWLVQF